MAQFFTVHPGNPQPRLVHQAAAILRDGGVVAYPTDSSYALGCRLGDFAAATRIRTIRGLGDRHFLTLACADLASAARFVRLANWQFRIVKQGAPGPFTFLLPASSEVPRRLLTDRRRTLGIRVPEHAVVRALLAELGEPILSSTLILPGDATPPDDPQVIRERLGHTIDLVIDAGPCANVPTTVIDLIREPPVLVRRGGGDPARLGLELAAPDPAWAEST
ncbi:MAG: threonylcarbamoyl-AMP synthase [Burkholderiales bacterium]|nr:threonylcarbamoyl-AMP synthase [Burkholderiales bacterium]